MARRGHSKSQSVASVASEDNAKDGVAVAPLSRAPTATDPVKRTRKRSTMSPPTSPIVAVMPPRPAPKWKVPATLQFPIVAALSLILNALIFSFIAEITPGDLAAISKHSESWAEASGLLAWKVVELAIYWFGGFDAYDVASASLFLSTPQMMLLSSFFLIHPSTLVFTTSASVVSTTVPFMLLRSLSPPNSPNTAPRSLVRNRSIITDPYTTISCSLLATAIFATLLEFSFATFLPTWLITHFDRIRDLRAAHLGASGLPLLLVSLLPAGYAAMQFIFIPSTAAPPTPAYVFDTAESGLVEHVYHNAWGWYTNRQKSVISRTSLLAAMTLAESVIQTWGTIEGVEFYGAMGYAGIWAVGVAIVGAAFDWVGGPSG